jgi:hypothetical protein|tara:strand:- start:305 stop:484 length:180 start_codon:yes stop_codon:yes gene_type:complete
MSDKKEQPENKFFSPKWEPKEELAKEEQPKEEETKSSGGYQGRRRNKVCNDGKDWKDFH